MRYLLFGLAVLAFLQVNGKKDPDDLYTLGNIAICIVAVVCGTVLAALGA